MRIILLSIFLLTVSYVGSQKVCNRRNYGNGAIVCVCNAKYCDTIKRPVELPKGQFWKYTSDRAGLQFQQIKGTFSNFNETSDHIITIDTTQTYQKIIGWGGAFTDSAGYNVQSLDPETQELLLRSYFSDDGIEYNLARVPIGGTDFSLRAYSYNDGEIDTQLLKFKLANEDYELKIPFIQRANNLSNGTLFLLASAWTAPKWMKTNGEYNGLGYLLDDMYQPWADYFIKFLDLYQKEGINFWGITTGNEPSLAFPFSSINTVGWFPNTLANWVSNNLGPTIRKSPYADIKILAFDDQRTFLPWFIDELFEVDKDTNISDSRQYIDGIAVHWYNDAIIPPSVLTETHNHFPEKFLLGTEASAGSTIFEQSVDLGSWERGERYAKDIIEDLTNWLEGWIDWNIALDVQGGPTYLNAFLDSPIIVNVTAGEFYKQPMYYALGHFSKFISRDSIRVFTNDFDSNVPLVAFQRPDNGTVLVILNTYDYNVEVTIKEQSRGSIVAELSPKSISTFLYW